MQTERNTEYAFSSVFVGFNFNFDINIISRVPIIRKNKGVHCCTTKSGREEYKGSTRSTVALLF